MTQTLQPIISEEEILQHFSAYQELAVAARNDRSHESDLKAALEIPSIFLTGVDRFEATFDGIIHHLSEAKRKATTDHDVDIICRTAEEMMYMHVIAIDERISLLKEENNRSFFVKVREFFTGTKSALEVSALARAGGAASQVSAFATTFAPGVLDLLFAYYQKVSRDSQLASDEQSLYLQIGKVYRKMLSSGCYSGKFSLLKNVFDTHRVEVIVATASHSVQAAVDLTTLARDREAEIEILIIASHGIAQRGERDRLIEFLIKIERKHEEHLSRMKSYIAQRYGEYVKLQSGGSWSRALSGAFWTYGCMAPIVIWVLLLSACLSAVTDSRSFSQTVEDSQEEVASLLGVMGAITLAIVLAIGLRDSFMIARFRFDVWRALK